MDAFAKIWSVRHPLLLLVAWQVFDVLSTTLALGAGGQEVNPVIAAAVAHAGVGGMVAVKWAVIALVYVGIVLDPMERPYVRAALFMMNTLYAAVLSSNFLMYGLATQAWALPVAFWALVLAIAACTADDLHRRGAADASR